MNIVSNKQSHMELHFYNFVTNFWKNNNIWNRTNDFKIWTREQTKETSACVTLMKNKTCEFGLSNLNLNYLSWHILVLRNHRFPSPGWIHGFYHPLDHLWQVQNPKVWHCTPGLLHYTFRRIENMENDILL